MSVAATITPDDRGNDRLWVPHRQLSLHQARKRSDLVRLLRMLFTTGAAMAAGVLIGSLAYSVFDGTNHRAIGSENAQLVTMQNPRFSGRDADGQPYEITATTAQRSASNPQLVELAFPALDDGLEGTVRAPRGVFDQQAQYLELFDDVVLTDAAGNRFVTTHARMFVQDNRVVGLQPLEGEGPIGRIRADSYEISDGGARVVFKGNVWTELQPARRDQGE